MALQYIINCLIAVGGLGVFCLFITIWSLISSLNSNNYNFYVSIRHLSDTLSDMATNICAVSEETDDEE